MKAAGGLEGQQLGVPKPHAAHIPKGTKAMTQPSISVEVSGKILFRQVQNRRVRWL